MSARILLALAIAAFMLIPQAGAQSVDEPRFVNRMLGDIITPSIVPGGEGAFSLTVNNPDPLNLTGEMRNVTLVLSIYRYLTLSDDEPVDSLEHPPVIVESGAQELIVDCGDLQPGGSFPVEFTIETSKDTPHGSYFSQSTYLVRFRLSFSYGGANYTMASRGWFTDEEWELLKAGGGAGEIDQDYLAELGYDGIIPDSGFSVRIPIPRWPFYVLLGLTCLTGFMSFYYHVMDNPGRYPRAERRFLRLAGRLDGHRRRISGMLRRGPRSP